MIQVFSTSRCPACVAAKKFMKDNNIPFAERNVETDQEAYDLMLRLGINSVPLIYLNDDDHFVGNNATKILDMAKRA